MAYTAVIWNIEEFGSHYSSFSQKDLVERLRRLLVVQILKAVSADVMVIQELRFDGIKQLARLKSLLGGGNWHFDWLPGAQVVSGQLSTFDQLGFVGRANSEGYGVLWRDGKIDALNDSLLSAGLDTVNTSTAPKKRAHYIDVATSGKKLKFDKPLTVPIYFDATSDSETIGFPHSVCPQAVNNTMETRSGGEYGSDDAIQQELNSRRPCRVQMHVTDGRSVPLVVYHAPVGAQSSRSPLYGTLIGCSVDPLQFANPNLADCVYAGDFNVVSDKDQATLSKYLPTIGYTAVVYTPSMVHVFKDGAFRTGKGVFGSARDVAFTRAPNGQEPTTTIRDVLMNDIIANNGSIRQLVTDAMAVNTLTGTLFPALKAEKGWTQNVIDVATAYLNGVQDPNYPHGADIYTAAAIVYTAFVSDHLPIVISYA